MPINLAEWVANATTKRAEAQKHLEEQLRAGRKLYADEQGQPTLKPSFITYLDELGTSARLPHMTDADLRADIEAYDRLRSFLHDDYHGSDSDFQRVLYFTDNVVIAHPIDFEIPLADHGLFLKIASAADYQLHIALTGRLLRGAICQGDAYADHSFVSGPALLQAVKMEEEDAVNPRIILDDNSIALALWEMHNWGHPHSNSEYKTALLVDQDGQVFVNYLNAADQDELDVPGSTERRLIKHKAVVELGLSNYSNTRVGTKYRWLAAYHNYVCEDIYRLPLHVIHNIPTVKFKKFTIDIIKNYEDHHDPFSSIDPFPILKGV